MAETNGVSKMVRNGTTYWYVRVDGDKQYCGKDEEGRKLAEAARAKFVAKQYENRQVRVGLKVKKVKFKSVREMLNWYMEIPRIQRQKSYERKVDACVHLLNYFGNKPVYGIESDDIERYREKRKAATNTINLEIRVLSAAFNEARKAKKIQADMLPGAFPLEHDYNPRPIITDEQYEELLKEAKDDFADVLICGYESAMRSSEITNLRLYQVHLDSVKSEVPLIVVDYIDLGIFDTKTGARRTVPVSSELKQVLKSRLRGLDPEDRVFTRKKGRSWTASQISKRFRLACERAELPYGDKLFNDKGERIGLVFHCLRHTRTTKWVEMGFSDEIIRRATGQKSLEAYQRYVKLDPSAVMRLVEKADNSGIKTASTRV